ncbi:MAG: glycerol-3-phosphate dehydrogenase/oxidase [Thermodesulfobacteriota bacterium]|jgi:glycerol-3-phosphate dehydrogenase
MKRKPEALADNQFDILVIGGGILGAAIVQKATERGFKSALIEKGDFGQATSSNSLKTIHGGLRYLQQADLKRIRQSIRARRKFMSFAPHLIIPQPFIIPVYGHGVKGKEIMAAALKLNDLLSWDRNKNLPEENFLPRGRLLSREDCLKIIPDIEKQRLTGGALWYDGQTQQTERLTLEFILAASEKGAVISNYVLAKDLLIEQGRVKGITAEEVFSKSEFPLCAEMVINASGPWLREVLQPLTQSTKLSMSWVKGMNLIIHKPLFQEYGVGLKEKKKTTSGKGSRFFFFIPWHGQTMIGTAYNRYVGDPGLARLEEKEIAGFLEEINASYPPARLTMDDVSFGHDGLLPVSEGQKENEAHPEPDRHSKIFDHESLAGVKGLISVKSTKYTTAPVVAERVLNLVAAKGNMPTGPALESAELSPYKKRSLEEDMGQSAFKDQNDIYDSLVDHFWQNYGPRSKKIIEFISHDSEAFQIISKRPLVTAGEVLYGVREEMALKLSDIVCRRTDMAQTGCPTQESLQKVSEIMSRELGWDEIRRKQEIESVLQIYRSFRKTV